MRAANLKDLGASVEAATASIFLRMTEVDELITNELTDSARLPTTRIPAGIARSGVARHCIHH
ncbi:hypothetical protein OH492_05150 [Vibrio chagasii]|nr:hypothetical protein [Vibrio chagasii]